MINEITKLEYGDCLEIHTKIKSSSVDLILTDLPYGTIKGLGGDIHKYKRLSNCNWDEVINIEKIMNIANRILRKNGKMILFCQEPFTTKLITQAIPNIRFNYKMIWLKDHFANALTANKAPVNYYEDILVFTKINNQYPTANNPVFVYLKECKEKSGMTTKEYNHLYCDYIGKTKNKDRSMLAKCWEKTQFWFPNKEIYENVLQATGFFPKNWELLNKIYNSHQFHNTFNLWEGNKYKSNVLKYKKDYDKYHPTQKPILLLEDLIKTFSNKDNLVVDLTMGSGSTGVACFNTKRRFIGIEKEKKYFDIATKRIQNVKKNEGWLSLW